MKIEEMAKKIEEQNTQIDFLKGMNADLLGIIRKFSKGVSFRDLKKARESWEPQFNGVLWRST